MGLSVSLPEPRHLPDSDLGAAIWEAAQEGLSSLWGKACLQLAQYAVPALCSSLIVLLTSLWI